MFPCGFISLKEVLLNNDQYIIYLECHNRDCILVQLTDGDSCHTSALETEAMKLAVEPLGLPVHADILSLLKVSINENRLCYYPEHKKLSFILSQGFKTTNVDCILVSIAENEKAKHLRKLLLQIGSHISNKNLDSLKSVNSANAMQMIGWKKMAARKRSLPGMSLLNPSSRRVKTRKGIEFEENLETD